MNIESGVVVEVRDPALALSENRHLLKWVEKMVELTKPASIHWVDGSQEEYDELCSQMVESGTFIKLNEKLWPGCYYSRSDADESLALRIALLSALFLKRARGLPT